MKIVKTKDGFDTLFSIEYDQTFHSEHGALQEAQHVFLQGAGVQDRFNNNVATSVLEIGFGTGFNFFLTAKGAIESNTKLEFVSLEKLLLPFEALQNLNHDQLSQESTIRTDFLDWRKKQQENIPTGKYLLEFNELIRLTLLIGDALEISLPKEKFNAVYLDAFSPDNNPELWSVSFFKKLIVSMKSGSTLSTYSAKGAVKRAMLEAGFDVFKKEGPPGKREMLIAKKI